MSVLHDDEDFHSECLNFARRLQSAGSGLVYSNLLRLEFWQAWRRATARRGLPSYSISEPDWQPPASPSRTDVYQIGDRFLRDFLRNYNVWEISIGSRLLDGALQLMGRYNLKSHDACVAALAFQSGFTDIVSLDRDFRRLDGVRLWNNGIPGRRAEHRPSVR